MLPPKLAALYGEMEKVRGETLSALPGLTEEEFSRKAGEEWSAAQILHHLLMAETGTSKVIRKSIKSSGGGAAAVPDGRFRSRRPEVAEACRGLPGPGIDPSGEPPGER